MRRLLPLLLATWQLTAAVSPEHAERRERLRKMLNDGVLVLFGARESEDLHYGFFQDTNFLYLTGWEEPGAILILTPEADQADPAYAQRAKLPREILFLPQRVPGMEKWTGRKLGPSDATAGAATGFSAILPAERFESELRQLLESYPNLYTTGSEAMENLRRIAPLRNIQDVKGRLGNLRMNKSENEIARIQRATDVSVDAHRAAWKALRPGQFEYQIAGVMTATFMSSGCPRGAYAPIVGSGPNSTILHYSRNARRMDSGELAVMDVAAECGNYASDITRTVPVNGKFTKRQREIYDVVLGAQNAAIAALKPGVTISQLTSIAREYINSHGKDLQGQPLGKYFIHGLSHHVGLDVHDESTVTAPLKAGMVITIEPGIYLPEESLGVRIEDIFLVTPTGSRNMSGALPRDPDELERALAQPK